MPGWGWYIRCSDAGQLLFYPPDPPVALQGRRPARPLLRGQGHRGSCRRVTPCHQSHFTSRHYWEVGGLDPSERVGWLGRFLDRHGTPDNPRQSLTIDYSLSPTLAYGSVPVAAVGTPEF